MDGRGREIKERQGSRPAGRYLYSPPPKPDSTERGSVAQCYVREAPGFFGAVLVFIRRRHGSLTQSRRGSSLSLSNFCWAPFLFLAHRKLDSQKALTHSVCAPLACVCKIGSHRESGDLCPAASILLYVLCPQPNRSVRAVETSDPRPPLTLDLVTPTNTPSGNDADQISSDRCHFRRAEAEPDSNQVRAS